MRPVQPQVTRVEGVPSVGRRLSLSVYQNQPTPVRWIIRDAQGNPVNLEQELWGSLGSLGSSSSSSSASSASSASRPGVWWRVAEVLNPRLPYEVMEFPGYFVDEEAGLVGADLPEQVVRKAGIYLLEVLIYDEEDRVVFFNQGYLVVQRTLSGNFLGPPSLAEIRLHLRDSGPEDNYLLDDVEFDLTEIAACIERPVAYWNESLPPIDVYYTTDTFPYRFHWLEAIVAGLYELAAHHYRRNRLAVGGAGGTQLDDKNKSQEYEEKSRQKWAEYKRWVQAQKVRINAESCYGNVNWRGWG